MNKQLLFLLSISFFLAVSNSAYLGKNEHGIDVFTIDLNLAPKYRFNETATFFKDRVHVVVD